MAVLWPVTLPQYPQQEDFAQQTSENRVAFNPERGEPKFRRKTTKQNRIYGVSVKLNLAQKATLENFVETTLKDGVLPFTWINWDTLVACDYKFTHSQGLPTYTCLNGVQWRASMQLIRLL